MRFIKLYCRKFWSLKFAEKHVLIGTVASILLAVAEVSLAFVVFRVTVSLQRQANYLQRAQFRMEENTQNAERARVAAMAFGIETSTPGPSAGSTCTAELRGNIGCHETHNDAY